MQANRRGDRPAPLRAMRSANTGLRFHSRAASHDPRWPAIAARLALLREQGRRAVRIVDADCAAGALLLHTLHHARSLGFTAIEGRGIDGSPALIGRARSAAAARADPAIGVVFEVADIVAALLEEQDLPADIILWHSAGRDRDHPGAAAVVSRAGEVVIADSIASTGEATA